MFLFIVEFIFVSLLSHSFLVWLNFSIFLSNLVSQLYCPIFKFLIDLERCSFNYCSLLSTILKCFDYRNSPLGENRFLMKSILKSFLVRFSVQFYLLEVAIVFETEIVDLSEGGGSVEAFVLLLINPNPNLNASIPSDALPSNIDYLVLDIVVVVDYYTNFFGFLLYINYCMNSGVPIIVLFTICPASSLFNAFSD